MKHGDLGGHMRHAAPGKGASALEKPQHSKEAGVLTQNTEFTAEQKKKKKKKKTCTDRLFPKMGECREVLGGGPAPPSKL